MTDMSDPRHFTPGVLPSDTKLGTDDPEEEAEQLEGVIPPADEEPAG